jgi:hypothetical protein
VVAEDLPLQAVHHETHIPPQPLALPRRDIYVQEAKSFGQWQWLLNNAGRLAIEVDFDRKGPARKWDQPLLIEQPGNQGDYELWGCLLQYLQRTQGDQGVKKLFTAFWGRKALFDSRNLFDRIFWQTMTEAALKLDDDDFLKSIYLYAEWMRTLHNTEWPDLYMSIVPHFLQTHQHRQAMKWHLLLSPSYYPGPSRFIAMMQEFSSDSVLMSSFTLQSMYIASPERRMYDSIVPHLYNRGQSMLAVLWRTVCIKYDDGPRLHAPSRQFLRWLQGYRLQGYWHPKEAAVVAEDDLLTSEDPAEDESAQQVEVSREYMNYLHGRTFGFTAKTYNDRLGARWFASTWVGLDAAISAVAALGVQQIGPLSLQSICLREETSKRILVRISQLEQMGISLPDSGYVNCIRHFAKTGDEELLLELLRSDLHPDVFDDLQLQFNLMKSSAAAGNWTQYTLLLAARLVTAEKSTRTTANTMLRIALSQDNCDTALRILDDVKATNVVLDVSTCDLIFQRVEELDWHAKLSTRQELKFCLSLCRRLMVMDVPVPVFCWNKILYVLGRSGLLRESYNVCVDLIDFYSTRQSARPGFVPIHKLDVPPNLANPLKGVPNLTGIYIPLDTPRRSKTHPFRQIFHSRWQADLIRWSFRAFVQREPSRPGLSVEQDQQTGRLSSAIQAVRLLRRLREQGAVVHLDQVRKAIEIRLAELYGVAPATKNVYISSRLANHYSLEKMKTLLDAAWGSELLPPLKELRIRLIKLDDYREERHQETVKRRAYFHAKYPNSHRHSVRNGR